MSRYPALDVARGIAILGILIANIPAFSGPAVADSMGATVAATGADAVIDGLTVALVGGKCRGLLALLFGIGIAIQFARVSRWPGSYLARCLTLALIGLAHGWLLWFGDILLTYALTALIVSFMISWSTPRLIRVIKILFGICIVLGVLLGLSGLDMTKPDEFSRDLLQQELRTFSNGSYLDQVLFRVGMFPFLAAIVTILQIHLVPVFLAGVVLFRSGVVTHPTRHPELVRTLLLWGLGLGLPLNLLALAFIPSGMAMAVSATWELVFGPLLALGVLMGVVVLSQRRVATPIANVGRYALTNYILQSVLCTAFFYGLGMFNRTSVLVDLAVVAGVWLVNLGLSAWMAHHDILGPMERLLRIRARHT